MLESVRLRPRLSPLLAAALLVELGVPASARCQIAPAVADQIRNSLGNRVDALAILGGDFAFSSGSFSDTGRPLSSLRTDADLKLTKFGGDGDVGDPQPLGNSGIGWQPRVMGNMGYLHSIEHLHSPQFDGDSNEFRTYAIEFGGGARIWVNQQLSFAPTLVALYGHTSDRYTVNSAYMQANQQAAARQGLIDWNVDTLTARAAVEIEYIFTWDRTLITLASQPMYFHTEILQSSNTSFRVTGDSRALADKIDVDIPLGKELFGHELRTGGYFSRTDLFRGLESGLNTSHMYEAHGRLVLDVLNELWKFQWIGLGGSYLWGPNFHGWTVQADIAFHF